MKYPSSENVNSDVDIDEGSSSDMEFESKRADDSDYESDIAEHTENNEEGAESFMHSYSDALSKELKTTSLDKTFIRANDQVFKNGEGTSNASGQMDEEFTPVDVDVNLVKSFLDSFSSQEGLAGPASNLLGLMGLQLPQDAKKEK
ncbi:hypothetical protein RJ640_020159 [Escallonia rubra]|uniref:Uncharacterized protein n=1 Tax=Escallonia rubra TaxID=112253 RepID=A0AA88QRI3_9ASTE|nr:hypothetical protein RJ640_020159 [Escallonia rubra]